MAHKLSELYIVRQTFKAGGILYLAGTVLTEEELLAVRLYRIRLSEQKLVKLDIPTEQIKKLLDYIEIRWGQPAAKNLQAKLQEGLVGAEQKQQASPTPPPGTKGTRKG